MAEPMDERELERLMREGLEQRAVGVDESAASELVAAARSGASRRPWRTTATIGLAAASVAGVALATLVLDDEDIRSGGRDDDVVAPVPQDWRLEAWHGVTVRVPADWGWGGAPMADSMPREEGGDDRLVDCGASAFVGADGQRLVDGDGSIPYVGRPVYMTDVCSVVGLREEPPPTAPYVWLGSPIDVGEVDLGNGYTQETVEVAGETVTVATDDPELREHILATATPAPTGELDCPTSFPDTPEIVAVPREGVADPGGITVCVLQRDGDAGPVNLVYSTRVGATAARAFKLALRRNPAAANPYCIQEPAFEWVLLKIEGADGVRQDNLVHLGRCAGIELLPGDGPVNLNDETVAPWAVDGIPAYVVGPQGELRGLDSSFFRGMLG